MGDNEDAAVLSFPQGKALIQTVDFFTPVVNDPFRFGQIAAANALSDVYAMGGEPFSAMNIVCFPATCMPLDVLKEVLRGGLSKIREAGAAMAGGHSVEDAEIKYGLAVSGFVDPGRFASNRGLRPGDRLLLTKPVGTGVLATAVKANAPGSGQLEETIWRVASRLNAAPGQAIRTFALEAATDITGFGLGGHALEMSQASGWAVELTSEAVPLLPEALDLARQGYLPAGSHSNRRFLLFQGLGFTWGPFLACRSHLRCADLGRHVARGAGTSLRPGRELPAQSRRHGCHGRQGARRALFHGFFAYTLIGLEPAPVLDTVSEKCEKFTRGVAKVSIRPYF